MAEQIRVRPKDGVVFPHAAPRSGFVGYEVVVDEPREGDHVMAGGPRYRVKPDEELVPNTSYYRRALARGDIEAAAEPEEPEPEDVVEPEGAPGESEG